MANVNSKKEGVPQSLPPPLPSVHEINHRRFRNALAIDPNALSEIHEMWGSEEPYAMAGLTQHSRHHVTNSALAIGACDVNKLETLFRVSNGCTYLPGGTQVGLVGRGAFPLEHRQLREQSRHRRFVVGVIQGQTGW